MSTPVAEDDNLRDKAFRSVGWVVLEKWSVRLVSLAVFAILARLLDAKDFGLLSMATVFTALLAVFVDSGFTKALVQRKTLAKDDAATAFWTSLGISVAIYALLFLTAPFIASQFGDPRLEPVLRILGVALPLTALSATPAALLEREFHFRALSLRQLAGTVAGAAVAIPMALLGAGVWALVAQPLVSGVVSLVTLWASTPWRPTFSFSRESLRNLYGFGAGVLGIDLLNTFQANIDKLLIGSFLGPTALGYYFIGQKVLTTLSELVTTVIARVSLTTFSRVQDDVPRLNRALQKMTFVSGSLAIPTFGITALLAPQLIPFVFGQQWVPAVPVFQLLAASAALASIMYYDQNVLLASGHPRPAFLMSLGQNVLGVGLIFAAMPFGIAGIALSRSVLLLAYWPVRLTLLHRKAKIDLRPYLKQVGLCLAAVAPVVALILVLQQTSWASVDGSFFAFAVPVGVLGLLVNGAFAWLLMGRANRTMSSDVLGAITRRVRRRPRPA
jgi:teichuronic acid exporter